MPYARRLYPPQPIPVNRNVKSKDASPLVPALVPALPITDIHFQQFHISNACLVLKAGGAGKHVFCEKPLDNKASKTAKMTAALAHTTVRRGGLMMDMVDE